MKSHDGLIADDPTWNGENSTHHNDDDALEVICKTFG